MSDVPAHARAVVIGAGIVGNCLVGHLARLGWTDLVLIDKGPLPNPGGSTGHASNFIFPTDHNKEMAFLTLESQRQYIEHGMNNMCGGIEVAREAGPDPGEGVLSYFRRSYTSFEEFQREAMSDGESLGKEEIELLMELEEEDEFDVSPRRRKRYD